jgi:hypothetical protein
MSLLSSILLRRSRPIRRPFRPTVESLDERSVPSASAASVATLVGDNLLANPIVNPEQPAIVQIPTSLLPPINVPALPILPPTAPLLSPLFLSGGGGGEHSESVASPFLRDVSVQLTATAGELLVFTPTEPSNGEQISDSPLYRLERVHGARFPDGAELDSETGEFQWMPTPGYYAFRLCVQVGDYSTSEIVHVWVEDGSRD